MLKASVLAELLLVVLGAWLYWRAARSVTSWALNGLARANIYGLMILICGIVILGMDFWQ